ncbi:PREDICTED: protein LSD1 isoform X1 [Camelina sativa]|uniref:Protein LSD1 isoform X1 n=1 Tax=Camelina sativa TaxID=90675 RepID=A0ABM0V0Y4_CAMSA|nr:PREDICTED: protein LSD1 isoform X1 [Camelina sativa]XP_010449176.1 PREDICTED: protein LSD1 isoform X1 [Camelina sativa]
MQDQLVCHGCRNLLMYPRGASNVRCALCNTINMVPPPHPHPPPPHGMDMAHIVCGGCRTMLMYTRGASSVRCSCCQTTNLVPGLSNQVPHAPSNQVAQINCGHCRTTLMYPYGASSVKCAVCQFVTNVNMSNGRVPLPTNRPNGTACPGTMPSSSTSTPPSQTQTVVVENPMSVDESGKLVSISITCVLTASHTAFFLVLIYTLQEDLTE